MRITTASALILSIVSSAATAADDAAAWTSDRAWILQVEASLPPTPGARPLADYVRYYTGRIEDGRRVLYGVYELPVNLRSVDRPRSDEDRVKIGPWHPPTWTDAGCGVVFLVFDVASKRVETWMCDGTA